MGKENRRDSNAQKSYVAKKDYGRIPDYLVKRRIEDAERKEQERIEAEKETIPPGMRLMGEEERLETLKLLNENAAQLVDMLSKLSLTSDTLKTRQRERGL